MYDPSLLPEKVRNQIIMEPNSGCWLWIGTLDTYGYGQIAENRKAGIPVRKAHRVIYSQLVKAIPVGLVMDHLCRVRCCVNPHHLEPVTPETNVSRGLKGRTMPLAHRLKISAALNGKPKSMDHREHTRIGIIAWHAARRKVA